MNIYLNSHQRATTGRFNDLCLRIDHAKGIYRGQLVPRVELNICLRVNRGARDSSCRLDPGAKAARVGLV